MAEVSIPLQLTDLPLDILLLITPYLSPNELLAFSSITPAFYGEPDLRYAASYWRGITRDTFRVPNHPVVEGDGRRWMRMYRKMRAQTKIYGWGNNDGGCMNVLGAPQSGGHMVGGPRRRFRGRVIGGGIAIARPIGHISAGVDVGKPEVLLKGEATVVADLQCGGWSTTILDSRGALHTSGHIDNTQDMWRNGGSHDRARLKYPPGFTPQSGNNRYDAYTAIKQFSSGRSHILGLSDAGRIWSWDHVNHPGLHVKFLDIDLVESSSQDVSDKKGHVRKVMAGFNRSSAYVVGTGIVTWEPSNSGEIEGFSDHSSGDGMLVLESWVVPNSGYLRATVGKRLDDSTRASGGEDIGEVVNYAVLENYVLFVTHLGKVFACQIRDHEHSTFQITPRTSPDVADDTFAADVQGSFRSFAILKRNGEVLTGDDTYLQDMENTFNKLHKIPSLQHSGVISMAFGDYHYHALHADGTISSYGHDPRGCGALGFGGSKDSSILARGMRRRDQFSPDFQLIDKCYTTGRRVWFEPEKRLWLRSLAADDSSPEGQERRELCTSRHSVGAEFSEWVEQKLLDWEDQAGEEASADEDELPAYFALSVAAAGWHSGALVLVDEEKAKRVATKYKHPAQTETPEPADNTSTVADLKSLTVHDQPPSAPGPSSQSATPETSTTGLMASTMSAVRSGVNWFLGTPTHDHEHADEPSATEVAVPDRWIWEGEAFPRLKLRNGEVMPGSVEVIGWTGPAEWQEVVDCVE